MQPLSSSTDGNGLFLPSVPLKATLPANLFIYTRMPHPECEGGAAVMLTSSFKFLHVVKM